MLLVHMSITSFLSYLCLLFFFSEKTRVALSIYMLSQDCFSSLKCMKRTDGPLTSVPGCKGEGSAGKDYCYDPKDIVPAPPSTRKPTTETSTSLPPSALPTPRTVSCLEWTTLFAKDVEIGDDFGYSVAISEDIIVVGARYANRSGSVFIFTRSSLNEKWALQQILEARDGKKDDQFGTSVAIDDATIVIGAPFDDAKGNRSGSVYIYTRLGFGPSATWLLKDRLVAEDGEPSDNFGEAVAIDGDTIVVGAPFDDDEGYNSGSIYIYTQSGSGTEKKWSLQQHLVARDGSDSDQFGSSVAIDDDTIVVGARRDDDKGIDSGSVYVYYRSGPDEKWLQQGKLKAQDGAEGDLFGHSVAIDGKTIVVGAHLDDDQGYNSGSIIVLTRSGSGSKASWSQRAKQMAQDGADRDQFGASVAIDDNIIVVGSYFGSVNVYSRSGATLSRELDHKFGSNAESVAIKGDTVVVGSHESSSVYTIDLC